MRHFANIATVSHNPPRAHGTAETILVRSGPLILLAVMLAIWLATTVFVGIGLGAAIEYRHAPTPIAHPVGGAPT